jgi:hypothetical protein
MVFIWIIMAYGMSSIIVWGSIFEPIREFFNKKIPFLYKLVSCMLCTSTWVGFIMSIFLGGLTLSFFSNVNEYVAIFFDGMFTAGAVYGLNVIIEYFEDNE